MWRRNLLYVFLQLTDGGSSLILVTVTPRRDCNVKIPEWMPTSCLLCPSATSTPPSFSINLWPLRAHIWPLGFRHPLWFAPQHTHSIFSLRTLHFQLMPGAPREYTQDGRNLLVPECHPHWCVFFLFTFLFPYWRYFPPSNVHSLLTRNPTVFQLSTKYLSWFFLGTYHTLDISPWVSCCFLCSCFVLIGPNSFRLRHQRRVVQLL